MANLQLSQNVIFASGHSENGPENHLYNGNTTGDIFMFKSVIQVIKVIKGMDTLLIYYKSWSSFL
jgi:hypothetical protein